MENLIEQIEKLTNKPFIIYRAIGGHKREKGYYYNFRLNVPYPKLMAKSKNLKILLQRVIKKLGGEKK